MFTSLEMAIVQRDYFQTLTLICVVSVLKDGFWCTCHQTCPDGGKH